MKTQLFSNSCGFEVCEWWCVFTDVQTYIFPFSLLLILTIILWIFNKRNEEVED